MASVMEDANAVLFPAFADLKLSDEVKKFLDAGGISILLGESREEYVARRVSDERRSTEKAEHLEAVTTAARLRCGQLLAAIDQELGGICRLHDLVPQFPLQEVISNATTDEIEEISLEIAKRAASLGINIFLAPILDIVTGTNVWLKGRTWSTDITKVSELSASYIRGVQRGGVAATAKHFPGFASTTGDPAVDASAVTLTRDDEIDQGLLPFKSAIKAGVEMIMVGPSILPALDASKAALRSPVIVDLLKTNLGFNGIVMADDLDAKAVMRGDSVETVAVDALRAGCDFLLLADIPGQLSSVSDAIISAVSTGAVDREQLAASAQKLRRLAVIFGRGTGARN